MTCLSGHATLRTVKRKNKAAQALGKLGGLKGGKARAAKIMERLDISPTRRVRGLGAKQRSALEHEFGSGDSGGR